jgi:hypothetical protein
MARSPHALETTGVEKFRDEFGIQRCAAGLEIAKHYKIKGACCDHNRVHGAVKDPFMMSAAEVKKLDVIEGYEDDPMGAFKLKRRGDEMIYEAVAKRRTEDVGKIIGIMNGAPNNIFVLRAGCQSLLELAYNDPIMKVNIRREQGVQTLVNALRTAIRNERTGSRTRIIDGLLDEDWNSIKVRRAAVVGRL